jgi:hypothetical protein
MLGLSDVVKLFLMGVVAGLFAGCLPMLLFMLLERSDRKWAAKRLAETVTGSPNE